MTVPRKHFLMTTSTPHMFCSPTVIFIRFASGKNQGIGGLSSESPPIGKGTLQAKFQKLYPKNL